MLETRWARKNSNNQKFINIDYKDDYTKRKEMWEGMDMNANGYLSLAEVTKVEN